MEKRILFWQDSLVLFNVALKYTSYFEIQLFPAVEQKRSPLFSPSVKSVDEETLLFFSCIAKFSDIFNM